MSPQTVNSLWKNVGFISAAMKPGLKNFLRPFKLKGNSQFEQSYR